MFDYKVLRLICEPETVFLTAARTGGPSVLFGLIAFELVLTQPQMMLGACLRATGAPWVSIMTLVQALLGQVSGPLLLLLVVATAYNMLARICGRGADLWAVVGALSYAWVPHTLALTALAAVHRATIAQVDGAWASATMVLPVAYGAYALRTLWRKGSVTTHPPQMPRASGRARHAMLLVGAVLVLGVASTTWHVATHWQNMRPKLAGDTVGAFDLSGINTADITEQALIGHVSLIDFWATWCGPCMQTMPELERLHRAYGPRGLRIMAVNIEDNNQAGVQSVIDLGHLSLPVYRDDALLASHLHVHVYPTSFLVDQQGRIMHVYSGPADPKDLEARIVMALGHATILKSP